MKKLYFVNARVRTEIEQNLINTADSLELLGRRVLPGTKALTEWFRKYTREPTFSDILE